MKDYEPFLVDESFASSSLFTVTIRQASSFDETYTKDTYCDIVNLAVTNGHTPDGKDVFVYKWEGKDLFWLVCENNYQKGTLIVTGIQLKMALDMAITIIYRYSSLKMMTSVIHASAVSFQGKDYLFLGNSGTGKSTNSRLWLKHFEGSWLLNDDNPILRLEHTEHGNEVWVYGSPWSGKTPCYKNARARVGGIVKLTQAPQNVIHTLRLSEAYAYMLSSASGLKIIPEMMDNLYETIAAIIQTVQLYGLECLPDTAAADVCYHGING